MATFWSSLLSELILQHGSDADAIVIKYDRATMPARSLRKRTRPSTRPFPTRRSTRPSYGRSVSSSAINNIRYQSRDDINKTHTTKRAAIYYEDDSEINTLSSPPPRSKKMGGISQPRHVSPQSVLSCVHGLLPSSTISHRSERWCPSSPALVRQHSDDSIMVCPKRISSPGSARWLSSRKSPVHHKSDSALTCPTRLGSLDML